MLYCTSTVAFGATSLKGGLFFSNPWREAIEGTYDERTCEFERVSNPWREAIEGTFLKKI